MSAIARTARVAAAIIVFSAGPALAQSICNAHYPVRATGAACNSGNAVGHIQRPDGVVVCCIGSPQVSSPRMGTVNIPSGADRYAAGLALGLAGASIVLDLVNMFGPSTVVDSPQREADRTRETLSAERSQARRDSARWYEAAIREVKKGDMRSADGFLFKAMKLAEDVGDWDTRDRYKRELSVVRATKHMKEGLALQAEGKIEAALLELNHAAFWSQGSGNHDLTTRIYEYRNGLAKANWGALQAKPKITKRSTCLEVNGKMMCE